MTTTLPTPTPGVRLRPLEHQAATLDIDLHAVASNVNYFRALTSVPIRAVVKANGFGHGAADVAKAALRHGADSLGVTGLPEAENLRIAGIDAPILSWLNPVHADWDWASANDVDVAIGSLDHFAAIESAARKSGRPASVHLHVDVGMSRDGIPFEDWSRCARLAQFAEANGLMQIRGLMGHLGRAGEPDGDPDGVRRFEFATRIFAEAGLRPPRHLAATAATLTDPGTRLGGVRIGAGLYGIDPRERPDEESPLKFAMTLSAPLIQIREVPAGSLVGYGTAHRCPTDRRLGLVPLGYGDGLPQITHTHAEVFVRGRRCRVLGALSMDQMVIDLGQVKGPSDLKPGEKVTIFGPGDHGEPTPEDWARSGRTLPHAILTGIGPRVQRHTLTVPTTNTHPPGENNESDSHSRRSEQRT